MYWVLAFRHLLVRPGRAAVLLIGYGLGVAVMIVLLSVGDAMLDQSRDVNLIGGGAITALPHGVDIEAMRTGGLSGMFFSINAARFVAREMLGGPRNAADVRAVSPLLEQKLLLVRTADTTWTVRAGGEIPSMARAAGTGLHLLAGRWDDEASDNAWRAPDRATLYDEIDHFHRPPTSDSSWAEWHYFNVVVSPAEWWYVTLLVGGDMRSSRWGGEVLVTHRLPTGEYRRYVTTVAAPSIHLDTARADLTVGSSTVEQRGGVYRVRGSAGAVTFAFTLVPNARQYFPPVELGDDHAASGYAVPALSGSAEGQFCVSGVCESFHGSQGYHDHNWGSWRAVTWEWGAGHGASHAILYGGVLDSARRASAVPFFLALEDSLGVQQVYRFDAVRRIGSRDVPGTPGIVAPDSLILLGTRGNDTLHVRIAVTDVAASSSTVAGSERVFLQMRGAWQLSGRAAGVTVADSGSGFFETWVEKGVRKPSVTTTGGTLRP